MNTTGRTIAKNATVMMISQLITWVMALALTIFLPRYLGAEAIGKYQLASSVWAVASIGIAFGMDTMLIKEIARDPERGNELLTNSSILRLIFYVLGFVLVSIYVRSVGYSAETIQVVNIVSLSMLIGLISGVFGSILQAYERMEFFSLSDIVSKAVLTVASIAALLMGYRVIAIAWIGVIGSFFALAVQVYGLSRIQTLKFVFRPNLFGWIMKSSLPYLLVSGFFVAYNQVDVIILSLLINETQIGWYSAAKRLYGTFLFIPTVLVTAIFPAFSRLYKTDQDELHRLLSRSLDILLLVGIPVGLGVFAIADPLIVLLFGRDFTNAGPVLAIMGISMIATHLDAILGKYYISIDRQIIWTWVMAIAAVLTIPLDLVFIPWFQSHFGIGAMGGGLSYLVTEGGMVVVGILFLPKGIVGWKTAWFALKVLLAGAAMALVAWLLRGYFIAIPILAGAAVYVGAILLLRVVSQEDWALIKDLGGKVFSRFQRFLPKPVPMKE
jgi:O-antigen/teichoic acid export membrane protein